MVQKKSAAKVKPIKKVEVDLDEEWAAIKLVTMTKLKAEIEIAKRLDSILSIRSEARKFFNKSPYTIDMYMDLSQEISDLYKEILKRYSNLKKEDLMVIHTKDPYEDLIPEPNASWSDVELFEAMLKFICIQTYGNKFLQDHQRIMELMNKAGIDPLDKEKKDE